MTPLAERWSPAYDLAFTYELPTAIEYAGREAATRPLNSHFQNDSVRSILEAIIEQVPGYSVGFSGGIVDVFAAKGRDDASNLLSTVIKNFEVAELDTHLADMELSCALSHEVMPSGGCSGSIAAGKAMIGNQILPDSDGIPTTAHLDGFAMGLSGAGRSVFL